MNETDKLTLSTAGATPVRVASSISTAAVIKVMVAEPYRGQFAQDAWIEFVIDHNTHAVTPEA